MADLRPTLALAAALVALSSSARAQSYRLRGAALAQARAPSGILALEGDADPTDFVRVEALIWAGAKELGGEADALVAAVRLHDPEHRGDLWLGRQILTTGAIRPVHFDGGRGRWRFTSGTQVEAFGGLVVQPRLDFAAQQYDWTAGGRVSQQVGRWAQVGVAYLQARDDGRLADHEVGADVRVSPLPGLDLLGRGAWDLSNPGVSEAVASVRWTIARDWRVEARATHRSASRILPATSLFSVLGDVASQYVGGRVRWRAAPRLDLVADGGARLLDDATFEQLTARAVLRLDDRGRGAVSAQVRRQGAPDGLGWTGARATLRLPVADTVTLAAEVELVRPDRPAARGEWWPWGLLAARWAPAPAWEVALAGEASITREHRRSLDVLGRVAYRWSAP